MIKKIKPIKIAFTLAEVLITLVIIGVIAAVTIPALVNNFRFTQYRSGFIKAMSTLNQAVRKYHVDNGEMPECGYNANNSGRISTDCLKLNKYFIKALNIQKYCENNAYENGCIPDYKGIDTVKNINPDTNSNCGGFNKARIHAQTAFVTADGMIFVPYAPHDPVFIVDVNGFKGPNKYGYDMHFLKLYYPENNIETYHSVPQFIPYSIGCAFFENGGITSTDLIKKSNKN